MSEQDTNTMLQVSDPRKKISGSNDEQGSSYGSAPLSNEAANHLSVRTVSQPTSSTAPAPAGHHTQRYTHNRSRTAPPWMKSQQGEPELIASLKSSPADEDRRSPIGHRRSATVPTILITQPEEQSPPRDIYPDPRKPLLAVRSPALVLPPPAIASPREDATKPRVSRLAGLQGAVRSAEARKSRREAGE